ncbi:hypothetical protein SDC9_183070 [bioreactor metagenome]|uniref:Uncharacterized protein n=1 Tax=bioreactor metagenome TaxID=1076179 RepID=A0A645HB30_9ZZZZ
MVERGAAFPGERLRDAAYAVDPVMLCVALHDLCSQPLFLVRAETLRRLEPLIVGGPANREHLAQERDRPVPLLMQVADQRIMRFFAAEMCSSSFFLISASISRRSSLALSSLFSA